MNDVSPRSGVLQEASQLIDGDRNAQYGPPTQDFQRTAAVLSSLGYARRDPAGRLVSIVPSDVSILVMAVKMSRLMHSRGKRDNWVDLAGYAGCGFECTLEEREPAELEIEASPFGPNIMNCSQVHPQQDVYHAEGHPATEVAEVIEDLTRERDLWERERNLVAQERDKALAEQTRLVAELQALKDEKFLNGNGGEISTLRQQLEHFSSLGPENRRLREENRRLTRELAEAKAAPLQVPTFPWEPWPYSPITHTVKASDEYKAILSSYNGEPVDAADA